MTRDDDFSRGLLARVDAVAPAITVDTSGVITRARRRRAVARTAGALTVAVVLGGSGWAMNDQLWRSPAVAPAGQSVLHVAGEDDPTPQVASDTLGLDLTITPTSSTGEAVPASALAGAVTLLDRRLSSAGITDARVSDNGDGTISVGLSTNLDQRVVDLVGRPVELAIRPVLAASDPGSVAAAGDAPTAKGAPDSPSDLAYYATADVLAAYAQLDCSVATSGKVRQSPTGSALVACDAAGTEKYILGPVEVPGSSINVPSQQDSARSVLLQLTDAGTTAFGEMTTRLQGLTTPQNRVAVVLDGVVISSPAIAPDVAITDGKIQMTGGANGSDATHLAGELLLGTLATVFQIDNDAQAQANGPALCAEFPAPAPMPGDIEGWWSSTPADQNGDVIHDPDQWPEALMREHPRVALIATDSGAVISTWDRIACGQDPNYQPTPQADWPSGSIAIVDMDTNELLSVVHQQK